MKRQLFDQLLAWKNSKSRKPLILKGARQVGKTYLLKTFAEQTFDQYHYVNFEREDLSRLFQQDFDVRRLLTELSFHLKKSIDVHTDCIIFDEIQACPEALTSLKYFHEDCPELALCAAGSLLGIQLNPVSFPVGKVDWLNLYPMNFCEYLEAIGETQLLDYLAEIEERPASDVAHAQLWQQLKHYFVVGGLPEVVSTFIEHKDDLFRAFSEVRTRQQSLIRDYYADIAKHSGKVNAMHIDRVWRAVPAQLAQVHDGSTQRFRFKNIVPGVDRYARFVNVIDWLENAGLLIKVPIAQSAQIPLSAYAKENQFKLFLFDVGLLGAMGELSPQTILTYEYGTYKGYFAENYVAQSFLSSGITSLHSWQEGRSEIEFLQDFAGQLIPIEVKSGSVTHAKSLSQYSKKYNPAYKIICSAKPYYQDKRMGTDYLPLYIASNIKRFATRKA